MNKIKDNNDSFIVDLSNINNEFKTKNFESKNNKNDKDFISIKIKNKSKDINNKNIDVLYISKKSAFYQTYEKSIIVIPSFLINFIYKLNLKKLYIKSNDLKLNKIFKIIKLNKTKKILQNKEFKFKKINEFYKNTKHNLTDQINKYTPLWVHLLNKKQNNNNEKTKEKNLLNIKFKNILTKKINPIYYFIIIFLFFILLNTVLNYNKLMLIKDQITPILKLSLININSIKADLKSSNISNIQNKINDINNLLIQVKDNFDNFKSFTTYFSLYAPLIIKGDEMINLSFDLINIGKMLSQIFNDLSNIEINTKNSNNLNLIQDIFKYLYDIQLLINKVEKKINNIPTFLLPNDLKSNLADLRKNLLFINYYVNIILSLKDNIINFLGFPRPMSYIFLLQNNNEIRPTGGFMGSIAIINTKNGDIEIEFKDIYDYDGQFKKFIEAPDIMKRITPNFSLRDANFYSDFQLSAKQISWFFENSGGFSADFIFAINQNIIYDLLSITGPIFLPKYNITFNKDNYLTYLMLLIEAKIIPDYPKQILFDLAKEILIKILNQDNLPKLPLIIEKMINQRDIQAFSFLPTYQKIIEEYKLDGKMKYKEDSKIDYFNIVVTSISGNKSDRYIQNDIQINTKIENNGTIYNSINYTRKHTWNNQEELYIKNLMKEFNIKYSDKLIDILGRGKNISYIRFYLPLNATIISTNIPPQNYRVYNEMGYTVFALISEIEPQKIENIELNYKLSNILFKESKIDEYKFYYQKQSGLSNINFSKNIELDKDLYLTSDNQILSINQKNVINDISNKLYIQKK